MYSHQTQRYSNKFSNRITPILHTGIYPPLSISSSQVFRYWNRDCNQSTTFDEPLEDSFSGLCRVRAPSNVSLTPLDTYWPYYEDLVGPDVLVRTRFPSCSVVGDILREEIVGEMVRIPRLGDFAGVFILCGFELEGIGDKYYYYVPYVLDLCLEYNDFCIDKLNYVSDELYNIILRIVHFESNNQ